MLVEQGGSSWRLEEAHRSILVNMMKSEGFGKTLLGSRHPQVRQAAYFYTGRLLTVGCRSVKHSHFTPVFPPPLITRLDFEKSGEKLKN